jgi:hypothetical protein
MKAALLWLLVWLLAACAISAWAFAFVRAMPKKPPQAGHYVQFGMGPLILDTTTGRVCDSYPGTSQQPGGYPPCNFKEGK